MELKKLLQRLSQNHLHIAFPEDSSEEAIEQSVRFNSQAPNFSSLKEEDNDFDYIGEEY